MPITTRQIDIMLRGVRAEFAQVTDQAQKQVAAYDANVYLDATNKTGALFVEDNASGYQRKEYTSITGVNELLPTEELQAFPETTYETNFITSVEPYKFSRRIKVSQESVDRRDTRYQSALSEASKLQYAYVNTRNRHKFDRFNNAFATVTAKHLFDYNDKVALCSASHPTRTSGTVQSNLGTAGDITDTNIEILTLKMQNQTDDIGEPMPMGGGHKYIVVPPAKVTKAKKNIAPEATWEVGTANNTINVWSTTGWTMVTSPFLSAANGGSDTAWFIIDSMYSPLKEVVFKPVTNTTWYDDDTKAFVYDLEFQHKVGAVDWRGIAGNAGA